jgi:hypothetical protein
MNNRTAFFICTALILVIGILTLALRTFGAEPGIKASSQPAAPAPIPTTPDTAAPIISTAPPSTTLPEPTTTRPPTTTTTEPEPVVEPEVEGRSVDIVSADASNAELNTILIQIAVCEQPDPTGTQPYGVNWKHRGPTYQGGLGLWYGTWTSNRPAGAPDNAGDATIDQQLEAGRNIYSRYGWGAWGCARKLGFA